MPVVTYPIVVKRLQQAKTKEELERVSHLIQFVPGTVSRDHLARIYQSRANSFKPQK